MKNFFKIFGIVAIVAIIGFSITACGGGGGGGGSGAETLTYKGKGATSGDTYTLTVKKTAARAFTPIKGDEFELSDGTDKSKGEVESFDGSKFTLQPSNDNAPTFDATVSGNDLTDISGTITLTDGTKVTVDETLTPVTPPSGGGSMKWTAVSSHPFAESSFITSIAFVNGKFFVLGHNNSGDTIVAYSSDGKTWTTVTDSVINDMYEVKSIAYGGGKFVIVGRSGKMAYSTNGTTWTDISTGTLWGPSYNMQTISAIAYGNNKFIAGGDGSNHTMAYSTDGVTWTEITDSHYQYVLAFGGGKFITGGYTGHLWYSTDGITWTEVADSGIGNGGEHIKSIVYGDGKFAAAGDNRSVATSTDGITWTAVKAFTETGGAGANSYITYGGGKFVVGRRNQVAYSANGTTWNTIDLSNIFGSGLYSSISGIVFGNGTFVVVGASVTGDYPNLNSTGKIAYSTGN